MKTSLVIGVICILGISHGAFAIRKVAGMQKALEKRYLTATAASRGGLELNVKVSNLLKDSLIVEVPVGWRFVSNAGKTDYQDVLLTRPEVLALKPGETKTFLIKGFCCEASRLGPVAGVPYTNGHLADSNLVALARYLSQKPMDRNTQQYAVWALSDGFETANITLPNDSLAEVLRCFVAKLKGEELPWYTLLKKAVITAQGGVYDYPVRFRASIACQVARECYSYCYLVDEKGNTVSEICGAWLRPGDGPYAASFNVTALKKGQYNLVLENKENELFRRSFKI